MRFHEMVQQPHDTRDVQRGSVRAHAFAASDNRHAAVVKACSYAARLRYKRGTFFPPRTIPFSWIKSTHTRSKLTSTDANRFDDDYSVDVIGT